MAAPLVTVLMPVYNGAAFLGQAIDSVLKQTLVDLELLAIDDGSTDDTENILRSIGDRRLRLLRNATNLGLIATLNKGLDEAKGEFIARMDADDLALPYRLERQVNFLRKFPRTGLCGTWFRTFGGRHRRTVRPPTAAKDVAAKLFYESPLAHPSVMFRRALFKEHNLRYSPDFPHAEDYELWTRVARVTEIANLPEVLLYYRQHEEQVSSLRRARQEESVARVQLRQLERIRPDASEAERLAHLVILSGRETEDAKITPQFVGSWLAEIVRRNNHAGAAFPPDAFRRAIAIVWWRYCSTRASEPGVLKAFFASDLAAALPLKNRLGILAMRAKALAVGR